MPAAPPTQFTAHATYSDDSTQDVTTQTTWSSSNSSIAVIGAMTGIATPTGGAGTITISATFGGDNANTLFSVTSPAVMSVVVTPANPQFEGQCTPASMTATAEWSDGTTTNVTSGASWTSSATTIATVDVNGRVTCVSQGVTEVSAAFAG
jgi:hypothetical protein